MAEGGAQIDQGAHVRTYSRFIRFAKFGTAICAVIAAIVVLIISR